MKPSTINRKVRVALKKHLLRGGLPPKIVRSQRIAGTDFRRYIVVAPKFENIAYHQRQDIVWRILECAIPNGEDRMLVSMIVTMSMKEWTDARRRGI